MINIESKIIDNTWNVNLSGELDVSNCNKLKLYLNELLEEQMLDITLDIKRLEYIDSTGLGIIIGILKVLKGNEKEIKIVNCRDNIKKILNITGLDKIFNLEG
ncbi:MAG: STAS domain-containing protein [Peptostreptococcaceae bacterium]